MKTSLVNNYGNKMTKIYYVFIAIVLIVSLILLIDIHPNINVTGLYERYPYGLVILAWGASVRIIFLIFDRLKDKN